MYSNVANALSRHCQPCCNGLVPQHAEIVASFHAHSPGTACGVLETWTALTQSLPNAPPRAEIVVRRHRSSRTRVTCAQRPRSDATSKSLRVAVATNWATIASTVQLDEEAGLIVPGQTSLMAPPRNHLVDSLKRADPGMKASDHIPSPPPLASSTILLGTRSEESLSTNSISNPITSSI